MNIKSIFGALFLVTLSSSLHAIPTEYEHGLLISDPTTNFITDTNSGRKYRRFDDLASEGGHTWTEADVTGGTFGGWSIANIDIANDFINAILETTLADPCQGTINPNGSQNCGEITSWAYDAINDIDHTNDFGTSGNLDYAYFAFINDVDANNPIGVVDIYYFDGMVTREDNWGSITDLNGASSPLIDFLLYKNASVPEPSIVLLLSSGLILFGLVRRKKRF